jgi:hypothetical protein
MESSTIPVRSISISISAITDEKVVEKLNEVMDAILRETPEAMLIWIKIWWVMAEDKNEVRNWGIQFLDTRGPFDVRKKYGWYMSDDNLIATNAVKQLGFPNLGREVFEYFRTSLIDIPKGFII